MSYLLDTKKYINDFVKDTVKVRTLDAGPGSLGNRSVQHYQMIKFELIVSKIQCNNWYNVLTHVHSTSRESCISNAKRRQEYVLFDVQKWKAGAEFLIQS